MSDIPENTVTMDGRPIFSAPITRPRPTKLTPSGKAVVITAVGLPLIVADTPAWWRKVEMELVIVAIDFLPPTAPLNSPARFDRLAAIAKLSADLEQECRVYAKGWPEITDQEPPFHLIGPLHALAQWATRERDAISGDGRVNTGRSSLVHSVEELVSLYSEGFGHPATMGEKGATARFIYALLHQVTGSRPRNGWLRDTLRR